MTEKPKCEKCHLLEAKYCATCSLLQNYPTYEVKKQLMFHCPKCELNVAVPFCKRCVEEVKDTFVAFECPLCNGWKEEEIK
jgi:hypothetical protein